VDAKDNGVRAQVIQDSPTCPITKLKKKHL
jgi:hypothetical protein